jgi:uncharacterized protein (DUF305 family)
MKAIMILFVVTLGVTFAQHDMGNMQMTSHDMLQGLEGADLEITFLSGMIEHHKGAISMAQWILERTQNPTIKSAAETIITAQKSEIQQMTQWLEAWYGQGVDEEGATMMQSEMDAMMQAMETSANPNAAFLEQMSLHHNSAIDMAQSALLGSTHAELRELATNIIVTQAQEIAQYRALLEALPVSEIKLEQPTHAQHGSRQHDMTQHDAAQHSNTDTTSPYLDEQDSSVRGLSQEEIDGLLSGKGMGYARSAELNGYPGPRHVLDMANELQLSSEQTSGVTTIFEDMKTQAVTLGKQIVAAETLLSQNFAEQTVSEESLQEHLEHLTLLYTQLRQVHLQAHLATTPLLSDEQLEQYQTLRGYTQ